MSETNDKPYTIENSNLVDSFDKYFNYDEKIGDKYVKVLLSLINMGVDLGVNATLGKDTISKTIPELKTDLLRKLIIVKELAKDPIIQKNIAEATKEVVNLSLDTVEKVDKPLNNILDRLLFLISRITNKSVSGSLEISRGVISSALAEVPILGGLVDLALTTGIAFNRGSNIFYDGIDISTDIISNLNKASKPAIKNTQTIVNKVNETKNNLKDRFNDINEINKRLEKNISRNVASIIDQNTQNGGGKNIKNEINTTLNRISMRLNSL
jgi:hypothetical protein